MPFIYEFLYRGRPEGSTEQPAWHLIIGEIVEALGKRVLHLTDAMNIKQATEAGYDLTKVQAMIDADALSAADRLRSEHEELKTQHRVMKEKKDRLSARLDVIDPSRRRGDRTASPDRAASDVALDRRLGL